jgi:hypothetical protein
MRNLVKLTAAGAFALFGAAVAFPASASTLGVDFTGTPTSQSHNVGNDGQAYGYTLFTTTAALTVTGLGEFDDDNTAGISQNGDTVYLGQGALPSNYTGFAAASLVSAVITTTDSTQLGAQLDWAFTSVASTLLAANGSYWIAVVYGNGNNNFFSTSPVTTEAGVTLGSGAICGQNTQCSSGTISFGPDFETLTATPLPAALPLFAGGLGLMGFLGRRRKRKGALAAA